MHGLLFKLLNYQLGRREPSFWMLFGSIRQDLDRLFWCFAAQPWMGAPDDFDEDMSFSVGDGYSRSSRRT